MARRRCPIWRRIEDWQKAELIPILERYPNYTVHILASSISDEPLDYAKQFKQLRKLELETGATSGGSLFEKLADTTESLKKDIERLTELKNKASEEAKNIGNKIGYDQGATALRLNSVTNVINPVTGLTQTFSYVQGVTAAAPIQAGSRWVVERAHRWMNGYGKLRRCTEKLRPVVDFYLFLAAALVVLRQLIQRARLRYRWDSRPTSRRLR